MPSESVRLNVYNHRVRRVPENALFQMRDRSDNEQVRMTEVQGEYK